MVKALKEGFEFESRGSTNIFCAVVVLAKN